MVSSSPLKVLISLGTIGDGSKAGVYRVTENLCLGIATSPAINATFHAVSHLGESHKYFHRKLEYPNSRLFKGVCPTVRSTTCEFLSEFVTNTINNRRIHYKIARRMAHYIIQFLDSVSLQFTPIFLSQFSTYHSPFGVIPSQVRKRNHISRFTTIHDLIPITHPEYFEPATIRVIRNIVGSLDEEDYTLSVSKATRADLLANSKASPERAFVVSLAASSYFYPATDAIQNNLILTRYGIERPGYILSLCTFEIRKNIEIVISTFVKLHEDQLIPHDTRLVLVGGKGWKTEKLEQTLSKASAVRNLIIMPGFIPNEDLAAIYSGARVFTYMSFAEGFGLPPLEAMQCGVPVITSNTSSLPEVVGDAGVMLDPNDNVGLCSALAKMYDDKDFHAVMAKRALERSKKFSWDKFIEQTLECYRTALENKKSQGH